jgi:hypothetical protein
MAHYVEVYVDGKWCVRHMGEDLRIVTGRYDFKDFDRQKLLTLFKINCPEWYFDALANALVIMRGSAIVRGITLRPIVNWPFDVSTTSVLLSQMNQIKKLYGVAAEMVYYDGGNTNIVAYTSSKQDVEPIKAPSDLFMTMEQILNIMGEQERVSARSDICPLVTVALKIGMNYRGAGRIVAYSTTFDVWGYVNPYLKLPMLTYSGRSAFNDRFGCISEICGYQNFWCRTVPNDMIWLYVDHGYYDIDQYCFSRNPLRCLVVSKTEIVSKMAWTRYVVDDYFVYVTGCAINFNRISRDKPRSMLFTDFFNEKKTYRLASWEAVELMRGHVFLSSRVRVSGDERYVRGFPLIFSAQDSDVGFVGKKFEEGLQEYVSLTDGRLRSARYAMLQEGEQCVIEGTFVRVRENDTCDAIWGSNGGRFVYPLRSCMVMRKTYNSRGFVCNVKRIRIRVFSLQIVTSAHYVWFNKGQYDKCAKYEIKRYR